MAQKLLLVSQRVRKIILSTESSGYTPELIDPNLHVNEELLLISP